MQRPARCTARRQGAPWEKTLSGSAIIIKTRKRSVRSACQTSSTCNKVHVLQAWTEPPASDPLPPPTLFNEGRSLSLVITDAQCVLKTDTASLGKASWLQPQWMLDFLGYNTGRMTPCVPACSRICVVRADIDLVFVMDSSQSLTTAEWASHRVFARGVIDCLFLARFHLKDSVDKSAVLKVVDNLSFIKASATNTHLALEAAMAMFASDARPQVQDVPKVASVLIFLTARPPTKQSMQPPRRNSQEQTSPLLPSAWEMT